VHVETHPDVNAAIAQEKQLKAGSRAKKLALINANNPTWEELAL
jgi:putative endonuclease